MLFCILDYQVRNEHKAQMGPSFAINEVRHDEVFKKLISIPPKLLRNVTHARKKSSLLTSAALRRYRLMSDGVWLRGWNPEAAGIFADRRRRRRRRLVWDSGAAELLRGRVVGFKRCSAID